MERMSEKTSTVWVTKYALTAGVQVAEVEIEGKYAYSTDRWRTQYTEKDWHLTEAAALRRAAKMREAKITSLKQQIAKLEKLTFTARAKP